MTSANDTQNTPDPQTAQDALPTVELPPTTDAPRPPTDETASAVPAAAQRPFFQKTWVRVTGAAAAGALLLGAGFASGAGFGALTAFGPSSPAAEQDRAPWGEEADGDSGSGERDGGREGGRGGHEHRGDSHPRGGERSPGGGMKGDGADRADERRGHPDGETDEEPAPRPTSPTTPAPSQTPTT